MKTIIAGSRDIANIEILNLLIDWACDREGLIITEVVSGGARGADFLGEVFAQAKGLPVKKFLADWEGKGKGAGYIRNAEMAKYADALLFLWDGQSRGTFNMIEEAIKNRLTVYGLIRGGGKMKVEWPNKQQ